MSQHLPMMIVLLPLVAAPLCVLLGQRTLARAVAIAVAWTCLAVAWVLLQRVLASGSVSYQIGGFAPPFGIELRLDAANAYLLLLVSGLAAVVFSFGPGSAEATIAEGKEAFFYAALMLALSGLLGMTATGDAFNVFVFLEISSLASYTLIGLGRGRRALMAAFSYLIMGTIGGTFFLLGIGLMYQVTGTLNMADLATRLPAAEGTRTVVLALGLLVVGLGLKVAVFPLHQWLPNAYTRAPSMVSAFLAATATKVMYYVLIRVLFSIFGAVFVFEIARAGYVLLPLALAAMFVGSLAAIYQQNIKRLLAYSSVAQVGYMTLGLSYGSVTGLTAGLVHVFNHALMKGGLFLVVGCITYRVGSARLSDMRGLGRRMPLTMAAFVIGGLSLVGVPATVGFISKWYLVLGALEKGLYGVAALVLLSSLLALVYVWKVVETVYFRPLEDEEREIREAPVRMLLPTWALIAATVFFGLHTNLTLGVAHTAAVELMGAAR